MTMTNQDQLKYCYAAFVLCVVVCCIPQMMVQTFAMFFSIAMIIGLYIVRSKKEKESFERKELSSLIKTFWIWSAIYIVGVFVAGGLISSFGDMTAINQWTESIVNGATPDEEAMKQVTQQYMDANFGLIISMTILAILPAQIYAAIRVKQALSRLKNPPALEIEPIIG